MRYYIIAGEASGDLHGSNLMKGIYAEDPQAEIRFWGGDLMDSAYQSGTSTTVQDRATPLAAGVASEKQTVQWTFAARSHDAVVGGVVLNSDAGTGLVRHYKEGAVMGFAEVLAKAGRLLKNITFCKNDILAWKPDAVILIDYPGFNFKIAEFAHKAGFKVFYYIAPKVWASREGRIKKLKRYVDRLFIVFPFEKGYFDSKGVEYTYVGNPLVDAVDNSEASKESRADFLERNNIQDKPFIAMLAGSRKGEISTMMPVLTKFAAQIHSLPEYRNYQFIIAGAPSRSIADYSPWLTEENSRYIKTLFGQTQSIIRHAEVAVVNSGTASLETVLFGTPQIVGYIMNPITYRIIRRLIKVRFISLGNLIIDREAFKELIQNDCTADALTKEVRTLIEDQNTRSRMLSDYAEIRTALGGKGASAAVAKAMIKELRA